MRIRGLINELKFEIKCKRISELIRSVRAFWLLVASEYDFVLRLSVRIGNLD